MKLTRPLALLGTTLLVFTLAGQSTEPVDVSVIEKIKGEAARSTQLMEVAGALTNTYGARLTNSPSTRAAGEYVRKKLVEWKLADVRLETFNFGNGWTNEKFTMKVSSDPNLALLAYPKAWTVGTAGPVSAELVEGVVRSEADFARLRGKLKGKFVLILPAPPAAALTPPPSLVKRFTDDELRTLAAGTTPAPASAPPPLTPPTPSAAVPAAGTPAAAPEAETGFFAWVENALSAAPAQPTNAVKPPTPAASTQSLTRARVTQFYFEEGVAGMIEPGPPRSKGGVVTIPDTGEATPWRKDSKTSKAPLQIVVVAEHYAKLMETVQKAAPVTVEVEARNTYHTLDTNAFNVVADIKGTDKVDEFVVLGAHLDSWHVGKGATDNATGVAVVMEAVRILRTLNLPLRRTVRLGLWTGEEQGLLGSRAFVDRYFINRPIYQTKAAHSKLSVYFNVDNGTGAIRGVYLQGNNDVAPIFSAWMSPFRSMGMTTLASRSSGSSDHMSFDSAGLPGFQFIQDPIEYATATHHTNLDTFDKLNKDDMAKNAVIVASFVYLAANRDAPLPRKPLPKNIRPAGSAVP